MHRVGLAFAYDGSRFDSYARQPGRRTVEGELLALLEREGVIDDPASCRFRSGSRTDRGVSAAWNVVAFDTSAPAGRVVSTSTRAPEGLHLLSAVRVPDDFEPRHARRRLYRYLLDRPWRWARVRPAAKRFAGTHDFTNFRKADDGVPPRSTLTTLRYRVRPPGPCIDVSAPSFLWHQVRRIVSALEAVERGDATAEEIARALEHPEQRRDFGVAPAENLLLLRVDYAALRFPPPPEAVMARVERDLASARRRTALLEVTRGNLPTTRR